MSTPQALQDFANWVATIRGDEASEAQTYGKRLLQAWGRADAVEAGTRPGEKVFEAYAQNHTPGAYRVFWCHGPAKGQTTIVAITSHP